MALLGCAAWEKQVPSLKEKNFKKKLKNPKKEGEKKKGINLGKSQFALSHPYGFKFGWAGVGTGQRICASDSSGEKEAGREKKEKVVGWLQRSARSGAGALPPARRDHPGMDGWREGWMDGCSIPPAHPCSPPRSSKGGINTVCSLHLHRTELPRFLRERKVNANWI